MANTFEFTIVSPDGKKLVKECNILNVDTTAGRLGIMANHAKLVGVLQISHLNYKLGGESFDIAISGGILHVKDNEVLVLAETFETKEEIDIARAEASKKRAEERLLEQDPNIDIKRAQISLQRALNRLSLGK